MSLRKVLNIGSVANDGTGDTLRDAADKINYNFEYLFSRVEIQRISSSTNIAEDASYIFLDSPSPITVTLLPGLNIGDIKRIVNTQNTTVTINGTLLVGTAITMTGKSVTAVMWTGTSWAVLSDDGISIT
ncbi:MAG: hypothetical protein VW270_13590 [Candidatus Poseidoniales archaeon]